jgi:hypothetical protein
MRRIGIVALARRPQPCAVALPAGQVIRRCAAQSRRRIGGAVMADGACEN